MAPAGHARSYSLISNILHARMRTLHAAAAAPLFIIIINILKY